MKKIILLIMSVSVLAGCCRSPMTVAQEKPTLELQADTLEVRVFTITIDGHKYILLEGKGSIIPATEDK
jgi:uncharacterized lipoprotein YajG